MNVKKYRTPGIFLYSFCFCFCKVKKLMKMFPKSAGKQTARFREIFLSKQIEQNFEEPVKCPGRPIRRPQNDFGGMRKTAKKTAREKFRKMRKYENGVIESGSRSMLTGRKKENRFNFIDVAAS